MADTRTRALEHSARAYTNTRTNPHMHMQTMRTGIGKSAAAHLPTDIRDTHQHKSVVFQPVQQVACGMRHAAYKYNKYKRKGSELVLQRIEMENVYPQNVGHFHHKKAATYTTQIQRATLQIAFTYGYSTDTTQ